VQVLDERCHGMQKTFKTYSGTMFEQFISPTLNDT